jgi:O-antigen ligase
MSLDEISRREWVGNWLRRSSLVLLSLTLVLSSFTFRWVLIGRYPFSVLYVSDIPMIVTVGLFILAHYFDRKPLKTGPWYMTVPALILVILSLFSTFWAVSPKLAMETGLRTLLLFGVYLLALNTAGRSRLFVFILMAGLVLQSSVAVAQFLNQGYLGLPFLGELPRNWDDGRVSGLNFNPNTLGGFLAFIMPVVFGFYLRYSQTKAAYISVLAALALGTAGLIVTGSHMDWIGWIFGLALMLFLIFMARPRLFSLRSLALALLVMACVWGVFAVRNPEVFTYRFAPLFTSESSGASAGAGENTSESVEAGGEAEESILDKLDRYVLTGRLKQISESRQLIKEHLWGGVGAGNYGLALYYLVRPGPRWPIHNVPLLVTGELGVVGGICWLMLVLSPLIYLLANRRKVGKEAMLLGWSGTLLAIAIVSLMDYFTWARQEGWIFFWATLGFWAGYAAQLPEQAPE